MSRLSDDDSSDSSDDFLVPAEKIDLNSSFFKTTLNKTTTKSTIIAQPSSDDSDDDLEDSNDNVSSAELLAQVLKNFENAKAQSLVSNNNQSGASTEQAPSVAQGNDLSKEIHDLLLQGESEASLSQKDNDKKVESKNVETKVKSDYTIPEKGIQIHLPGENLMLDKKKKKQRDLQKLLQNKINQRIRTTQVFVHKVGLLTCLAHGFFLNKLASDSELLAITLSLVSPSNYPKERPDLKYIEQFTKWFTGRFLICEKHKDVVFSKDTLLQRVSEKKVYNYIELVLLYIATVRGLGINSRLVLSLQPPRLKPKPDELLKIPDSESKTMSTKNTSSKSGSNKSTKKNKSKSKEKSVSPTKIIPENSRDVAKLEARNRAAAIFNKSKVANTSIKDNVDAEDSNASYDKNNLSIAEKLSLNAFKRTEIKKKIAPVSNNNKNNKSSVDKKTKPSEQANEDSWIDSDISDDESEFSTDDDYVEKKPKKKKSNPVQKSQPSTSKATTTKKDNHRKLLSSDEEDANTVNKSFNVWVEVYLELEESWISIDVVDKKIHCSSELYKKAGAPVLYVVAWNSVGTLKDVTRRYCPHWLTDTRKKRVDEKWWTETLSHWKEKRTAMSRAEDEQLLQRELEQPLPKTVGECKGHPLYVLTRHLLKFEALHPPDAVPLGFLKTGEAIYSRHCVHTLYSRETWVKKARVVKPGEEAYKIVKSMPKFDKLSGQKIKDQPLEIFGKWQTMPYVPPEAKDGIVPRNEYGNVDLFKMCMLPKGTAYVNLPGLNRIARKLNIDCAQACVGFNFGCHGASPAFEGYVVCEEFEDTLREAWEEEQVEAHKRAIEKREKRIYGNWKKLIKGLIIRERLAAKYNFKNKEDSTNTFDQKPTKNTKKIPLPEKKPMEAITESAKVCDNDSKAKKSSKNKSKATKNKVASDDEREEQEKIVNEAKRSSKNKSKATKDKVASDDEREKQEKIVNEKVESIRKKFSRKATTTKVAKTGLDNGADEKPSGKDVKNDNASDSGNNVGIRMTRKRAAAAKNLVDMNVTEGGSEDEFQETAAGITKRKLTEKKVAIASKLSKRGKIVQQDTTTTKKIKR